MLVKLFLAKVISPTHPDGDLDRSRTVIIACGLMVVVTVNTMVWNIHLAQGSWCTNVTPFNFCKFLCEAIWMHVTFSFYVIPLIFWTFSKLFEGSSPNIAWDIKDYLSPWYLDGRQTLIELLTCGWSGSAQGSGSPWRCPLPAWPGQTWPAGPPPPVHTTTASSNGRHMTHTHILASLTYVHAV